MYYVDQKQIDRRLSFLPVVIEVLTALKADFNIEDQIQVLAQERALHLAIESVTDIGSLLIDGFLMREASSYEDIIQVLAGEEVIDASLTETLLKLVRLRKPLVQEYDALEALQLHEMAVVLPQALEQFAVSVRKFLSLQLL